METQELKTLSQWEFEGGRWSKRDPRPVLVKIRELRFFMHKQKHAEFCKTLEDLKNYFSESQLKDLVKYFNKEALLMKEGMINYATRRRKLGNAVFKRFVYDWSPAEIEFKRKAVKRFFLSYGGVKCFVPRSDFYRFFDTMIFNFTNRSLYSPYQDVFSNYEARGKLLKLLGVLVGRRDFAARVNGFKSRYVCWLSRGIDWEKL